MYAGVPLMCGVAGFTNLDGAPADADIVDDPLIRCLFDDAIGAYQAAQLRRLGMNV